MYFIDIGRIFFVNENNKDVISICLFVCAEDLQEIISRVYAFLSGAPFFVLTQLIYLLLFLCRFQSPKLSFSRLLNLIIFLTIILPLICIRYKIGFATKPSVGEILRKIAIIQSELNGRNSNYKEQSTGSS